MPPSGVSGFSVDPDLLRGLAAKFDLEARQLGTTISHFEGLATHVDQAFGLLGPSDDIYFEYLSLARDTVSGLNDLQRRLERLGGGLFFTADSYDEADVDSSVPATPLPA